MWVFDYFIWILQIGWTTIIGFTGIILGCKNSLSSPIWYVLQWYREGGVRKINGMMSMYRSIKLTLWLKISTKIFHYFARWFLAIRSAGDFISLISDLLLLQNTPHTWLFHFPEPIISPHWCLVLCFIYFHWLNIFSLYLSHTPFNSRQPPLRFPYSRPHISLNLLWWYL